MCLLLRVYRTFKPTFLTYVCSKAVWYDGIFLPLYMQNKFCQYAKRLSTCKIIMSTCKIDNHCDRITNRIWFEYGIGNLKFLWKPIGTYTFCVILILYLILIILPTYKCNVLLSMWYVLYFILQSCKTWSTILYLFSFTAICRIWRAIIWCFKNDIKSISSVDIKTIFWNLYFCYINA